MYALKQLLPNSWMKVASEGAGSAIDLVEKEISFL